MDDESAVNKYVQKIPEAARPYFDRLRLIVREEVPLAREVFSYGIIGYKIDEKRARVFISGWKDHVAMYPIPEDETLQKRLTPYIKGKGTLSFSFERPLPEDLLREIIQNLVS